MRIVYSSPLEENVSVEFIGNGLCRISFYENGEVVESVKDNGTAVTEYLYDVYRMDRPYYHNIVTDIENNRLAWLMQAKAEEEARTPVDSYQLRADVDFLEIISAAMNPYATNTLALDEPKSDPDVLEKARRYYPARWDLDRLRYMVLLQKLTEEDFQEIAGEKYSA